MSIRWVLFLLALATLRPSDWPPDSRLTPAAAVLLMEPSHEDAQLAVEMLHQTLLERPDASAHVVILAGHGKLPRALTQALRGLPRTEVHFVQDQREADAFGVTNGMALYVYDLWGRVRTQSAIGEQETTPLTVPVSRS